MRRAALRRAHARHEAVFDGRRRSPRRGRREARATRGTRAARRRSDRRGVARPRVGVVQALAERIDGVRVARSRAARAARGYRSAARTASSGRSNDCAIASGVSTASSRPRWISATRSQRSASSMYGVETTIVRPVALRSPSRSQNSRRETASTPVVGSSRNRISGRCTSAQQSASFCFMPPDSAAARRSLNGSSCV